MPRDDLMPDDLRYPYRRRSAKDFFPVGVGNRSESLQNSVPSPTGCDIDQASSGRIVGYKPSIPTGPVTDSSMLAQHLADMNKILDRNNSLLDSINNFLSLSYESPTESWYETKATTTSVTPDQLDTQSNPVISQDLTTTDATPGYNFLNINNELHGRNAVKLYVVNDGPDNMYLRTSIDGKSFSPEFQMINGEKRIIWNVYEVRYRSSTNVPVPLPGGTVGPGNTLRASEREIFTPYVTIVNNTSTNSTNNTIPGQSNLSNFTAQSQTISLANSSTQLNSVSIPNGFAAVITNNKNNTVDMFLSRSNAMDPNNRITLGVGDSISLLITDTDLAFVAFSLAGQRVDILAEQN